MPEEKLFLAYGFSPWSLGSVSGHGEAEHQWKGVGEEGFLPLGGQEAERGRDKIQPPEAPPQGPTPFNQVPLTGVRALMIPSFPRAPPLNIAALGD
jgi:hypothetical protein